jgi:hypothetical protein
MQLDQFTITVSTTTNGIFDQIYIGWLVFPDFIEVLDLQWNALSINIAKPPYDPLAGFQRSDTTKLSFSSNKYDADSLLILNSGFQFKSATNFGFDISLELQNSIDAQGYCINSYFS